MMKSARLVALVAGLAWGVPAGAAQAAAEEPKAKGVAKNTTGGAAKTTDEIDKSALQALVWRNLGPYRGGRSVAVTGVVGQPRVYYFGGTGGGIWKTTDAGVSFKPVADGQLATGSVGAIAVAEADPNVVYAGMGEAEIRGNFSHGDGVYKSSDAGKTWKNVGLRDSRQIGRIVVHPKNPDLVYVAALGHATGPNKERGVFRSKDGGQTWQNVLFVDEKTGAVELAMDPTNPRVMFAGFWQVIRTPYSLESGGPGSGLYRTTDGGDTWERVKGEGLPSKGVWGKVGVSVCAANPNRVWALIEAEDGGLFRSDDGGKAWKRTSDDNELRQRAWYYTRVFADPKNPDTVYVPNVSFLRSQDGGKTFQKVRTPHGDNHDLWIAPDDPLRQIASDDGGAHVTSDGGATWSRQDNQPTAQFYHVVTDSRFPYHVYGAQQDNSTVGIASRTGGFGIDRTDWYPVGGCESGYVAPKTDDPDIVYAGCYDGQITRYDHRTKQERDVTVFPDNPMGWGAEGMKYRFQWTAPIMTSPHDPEVLYTAGNVLFRSRNGGQSWEAISPDLTRNDPSKLGPSGGPITKDNTSVEYYCTIFAMAESRLEKGLLWTGSDDGLVYVSRDAGKTWTNVTPKDMPEWSMVSQVEPSPVDAGTMYLAANRYKLDDYRPFIYLTTDYGKSWKKITAGIPEGTFVRVVREDPARRGLLYAGTETGVYASWNGGASWQSLQLNLPVVPVTDIAVKDADVLISTQGRGFWSLDDASPLRQISKERLRSESVLYKPAPAYRFFGIDAPRPSAGQNPPNGALFYYALKEAPKDNEEVTIEVLDPAGKGVRKFSSKKPEEEKEGGGLAEFLGVAPPSDQLPAKAGLNRFAWDLRYPEATKFKGMILWGGVTDGPVAVPGTYSARLTVAGKTFTESFEVREDPRIAVSPADLQKQFDFLLKIRDEFTATSDGIKKIRAVRDQLASAAERAKGTAAEKEIAEGADALKKKLTAIEEALYQTKNRASEDPLNYPIRLNNKLAALGGVVASADAAPTDSSYVVYDDLAKKIDAQLALLKTALETDVPAFVKLVKDKDIPAIVIQSEKKPGSTP
jgi:photosystem II stability/assembly factor-like uncharacterized protein